MVSDKNEFLQHIKKIHTIETGYTGEGASLASARVNRLLNEGWRLLEIQKVLYGDGTPHQNVVYHLGHTDSNADAHQGYTKPEEL